MERAKSPQCAGQPKAIKELQLMTWVLSAGLGWEQGADTTVCFLLFPTAAFQAPAQSGV